MIPRSRSVFIHPRDLSRFRAGLGGIARYFADPPPADTPPPGTPPPTDWKTGLAAELAGDASLKDFKDVASLATAYRDTKALVGGSIRVPGPDASPEARAQFRERLKKDLPEFMELPTDPEKRKAARKEILESLGWAKDAAKELTLESSGVQLEAGVKLDENELRQAAVELGLDKEGFAKLVGKTAAAQAAVIKRAQAEQSVLKGEWGAAYEERRQLALAGLEKTGAPQDVKDAIANGTAPAAVVKWAYGLAKSVGAEAREVGDQKGGSRGSVTPTEALARLQEIENREEFNNPRKNPDVHRELVEKHKALLPFAYPDIAAENGRG